MRPVLAAILVLLALVGSAVRGAPLKGDARVGVLVDKQGTALVRPVGRERWTPLAQRSVLLPGDQVRTPVRGAHAAEIRLKGGGRLVLGPGGLIELPERGVVRLYRGDLEAKGPQLKVRGPGGFETDLAKTPVVLRGRDKKTETLAEAPRWLTGYRSSTTDEWMGSLVASVDGRNVPLSVGYHKVNVEIRDQIARTTVEQSFRNSTKRTLEGVFYFPLPADASIGGFGMWIGGELVEADIVEKQRARAIYEDILRRRKDPGLLEWSGGNLFKARVFPIFPHSEKRIRIRYTQVLPLEGSKLRYRYALRSELLRSRPLRELRIHVSVSSAMPLLGIASPTHEVRVRHTAHAASAEFDAQEYSPERDFELAVDVDRGRALTVVPHRRGEDGYFMLLLSPPDASAGKWQRDLLPEKGPLDLVLIADTSGSMDPAARDAQEAFLDSLLALLGKKDRFRLMACDVDARWFREEPSSVSEQSAREAHDFLAARPSLGWTDLDRALAAAKPHVGEKTVVVYVGDGIGTTGDADPVALAQRIRAHKGKGTWHAVSTSATYEKGVLDAIASLGGGSVRGTGDDPAAAAFALLAEAAQPAVKDLAVSFEGLRTARVYPERLPNLAAGRQQVVLGRFLPAGQAQRGTVVVTGTLAGQPVRYTADLELAENEAGNSFLPRLWARRHIDALLAQGRSAEIKDEIVAFSEEFGIMTPYTSFLVLENDADRERYGVARRVKMRDGERFFATGRDQAATELLAQQMKLARQWRLELRRRMLREIATLGTQLHAVDGGLSGSVGWGLGAGAGGSRNAPLFGGQAEEVYDGSEVAGDDGFFADADMEELEDIEMEEEEMELDDAPFEPIAEDRISGLRAPATPSAPFRSLAKRHARGGRRRIGFERLNRGDWRGRRETVFPLHPSQLGFPYLGEPSAPLPEEPAPAWDAETLALVRKLDRRAALHALPGGVEVRQEGGTIHPLRGRETSHDTARGIYGAAGWFVRTTARWSEPIDTWLAGDERGVLAVGRRLGRKRAAAASDRLQWSFPLRDHSLGDLARSYAKWSVAAIRDELGIVELLLTPPTAGPPQVRLKIDVAKGVLLEWASLRDGRPTTTVRFADHVQAGGMWWATRITSHDEKDRVVSRHRLEVKEIDAEACRTALTAARAGQGDVIFLGTREPALAAAKQAVHDQRAGFAEHFSLVLHWAGSQQWDRVFPSWENAAAAVKDKPGAKWLRAGLFQQGRKGAELKTLLQALAGDVAGTDGPATDFLARHLLDLGSGVLQPNEMLALLEALRPAFRRGDADWRELSWLRRRAGQLERAGQPDQARAIYRGIATKRPDDSQAVVAFARALRAAHRPGEALRVVENALQEYKWLDSEAYSLYDHATHLQWQHRDLEALLGTCERWIATRPTRQEAYGRYLSALLFLDREPEAAAWVQARFAEKDPADENEKAALAGAIRFALGEGWNFHARRIEEKWWQPLGELARRLLAGDRRVRHLASRILNNRRFRRTDAYAALQAGLLADLTAEGAIESMELDRLALYLGRVADAQWREIVDRLKTRWLKTPVNLRAPLAHHVLRLLDQHGEGAEALAFARERIQLAGDDQRPDLAGQLLQRLSLERWTTAIEDEMLRVLPAVMRARGAADEHRRQAYGRTIRWLADQLVEMRNEALLGPLSEREKLARKELRLRQRKARAEARAAVAVRFAAERDRAEEIAKPWFQIERIGLRARLGQEIKEIDGETRELMASVPIDPVLEERCAFVLAYLATRRKAPAGLADAALELLEKRVAAAAGPQEGYVHDWKHHVFRLLVALDRADALAARLATWIVPSQVESRWRIAHGYLMAETGRLAEAVASFEEVERNDELGAADYAALANWHLVLGDERKHEAARVERYKVMPEWQISRRIQEEQNAVSRHGEGVPRELDPDALRALRALLAKARRPASYVYVVRNLYRTIKDFRVLESLPYGIVGHTPEGIYPYLKELHRVLDEVHEEATCDALAARIDTEGAKRDVDRRGLLLLRALVERRAGDVLNQPGPHAQKGLAALQAAFKGAWLPGERRHMAALLAALGKIPQAPFAREQVRQLETLHRLEPEGTLDRLAIAQSLFETHWAYGRQDRAVDGLMAALDEYQRSRDGLTAEALPALDRLVDWLSTRGHFRVAEMRLDAELALSPVPAVHAWLQQRLFQVYVHALRRKGQLAIGQGRGLYDVARRRMATAMLQDGPEHMANTLTQLCALHRTAQKHAGIREAGGDLETFGYANLPVLIRQVPGNAHRMAGTLASTLHRLRGPWPGLKFLITYLEMEPAWWRRVGNPGWGVHAYNLAKWRAKAGGNGELEPRLLAIVTNEIERDLLSLQGLNRTMYQASSRWFWREKQEAFLAVALRVIETNPDSPARLQYAAEYIWSGLRRHDRAIAVLLEADRRGQLRAAGRHKLVAWLHERKRYPESLPLLKKLLAASPDHVAYHALKIVALHFSGRDADALKALAAADRRFCKPPTTAEAVLATLARACRECEFFVPAVPYYEEVIPLHQRTQPNRGVGRGTLSRYYGELAECHAGLGRYESAVDAASAAVVSWGRTNTNRATALKALRDVVVAIPDLDQYVAGYDIRVQKTGLDAPLVRKSIGLAYLQRHSPMQAVPHLLAARELQPLDTETHQALLQAYDAAKKPGAARRALLQSIAVAPLNLDLYAELGRRLEAAGDADGAERAWTSLAEVKPNEADGHRKLAQHRGAQKRHADAIGCWRQVIRIRSDEPEGWLSLALAQIRAGRPAEAQATLEHVLATRWDGRFGDVHRKARKLLK